MTDTSELSAAEIFRRAREGDKPAAPADNPFVGLPGYAPPPAPRQPSEPYKGMILPFSKDESGNVSFDSKAGLLGAIRAPFDYTYDVRTGKIPSDINDPRYIGGALETALGWGPGSVALRAGKGVIQAPAREAIDDASSAGFKAFRESQQIFPGDAYRGFLKQTADDLTKSGHYPANAGTPHTAIQSELARTVNHPFVSAPEVDALKTALDASGLKGRELSGTMKARNSLYDFLSQHGDEKVRNAVGDYRQARHSEAVTRPDAAQSELNIAKARGPDLSAEQTRTNIARLVNKIEAGKGAGKGFSDVEANILRDANRVTPAIDRAQAIGNALSPTVGGGGGLLGLGGAGTAIATGHPGLAAMLAAAATVPAAAGAAARSYANRGARRIADEADNAIRAQSPFAQQQWATSPNNFSTTPLATRGGAVAQSLGALQGPMAAAAVSSRMQEQQPPAFPPRFIRLPDGTIQETL